MLAQSQKKNPTFAAGIRRSNHHIILQLPQQRVQALPKAMAAAVAQE
jgi:hypothetical protein